jgi:hypothetical protein
VLALPDPRRADEAGERLLRRVILLRGVEEELPRRIQVMIRPVLVDVTLPAAKAEGFSPRRASYLPGVRRNYCDIEAADT